MILFIFYLENHFNIMVKQKDVRDGHDAKGARRNIKIELGRTTTTMIRITEKQT